MSWSDIPGWTDENLFAIYDQAIAEGRDGDTFVEVGVGFGRSVAYAVEKIVAVSGFRYWRSIRGK